jgi:hypothetical protein
MSVQLIPPTLADEAAQNEQWGEEDWLQWNALLEALERYDATALELRGPDILYAHPQGPTESVRLSHSGGSKPTLSALQALCARLEPPIRPRRPDAGDESN